MAAVTLKAASCPPTGGLDRGWRTLLPLPPARLVLALAAARSEALGRWPANVVLDERQADILDQQAPGASRFYYAAKPGTAERPRVDGVSHPSVKPLALMRWLIRLVTPAGGVVLDPFAGSGTTVEACLLESRRCIAIERDLSFLPLIEHRLTRQADLLRTESESA